MTVLLTGSTGLLGRRFSFAMRQEGIRVVTVGRSCDSEEFRSDWIKKDLSTPWGPDDLPDGVDTVVHLAQARNFRNFPDSAEEVFFVNSYTVSQLLNYCRVTGVRHFVLGSTGGLYQSSSVPLSEDSEVLRPERLSNYFASKLSAEAFASSYSGSMTVSILRYFFLYGPGQDDRMLIQRLANQIRRNEPILVSGDQGIRLTPTYVDDAAQATCSVVRGSIGGVFNISSGEVLSIRGIAERLGEHFGIEVLFQESSEKQDDCIGGNDLMKRLLHEPAVLFERGIELSFP